jgi:tetratricopeptide (TPR) repeat protein
MTKQISILVLAGVLAAGPLASQQGGINLRLAQGQPAKYTVALCPLKAINAKVEKGTNALRKAYDGKTPAERATSLTEARQNIIAAITQEAQATNAAAWYYLGRVALMQGNPVEADSAFTKAQDLAPACEIDITQYRQNNWAMLANAAIDFQKKGQADSAMALFRDANFLFRGLPHVYSNMGVLFANSNREDSAAVYFQTALALAEKDTSLVEDRNAAALNLAVMYQRLNKHVEAISALRRYLAWRPDDNDARKALSGSFRAAGMVDSAAALDLALVAQFSKGDLDSLDTSDLMAVGVAAFNAENYPKADTAFSKTVSRNPWSRDARYNLANTYFAMKNNEKLIEQATKLLEIEPMNEDALRLLGQGQRGLKREDDMIKTAGRLVGLPFTIEISSFQMNQATAKLVGEAIGRSPMDEAGRPIKTAPMTIEVEFVDAGGAVVDTREITVPVLASTVRHPIQLDAKGAGIAGWRYRVK